MTETFVISTLAILAVPVTVSLVARYYQKSAERTSSQLMDLAQTHAGLINDVITVEKESRDEINERLMTIAGFNVFRPTEEESAEAPSDVEEGEVDYSGLMADIQKGLIEKDVAYETGYDAGEDLTPAQMVDMLDEDH